MSTERLRAKGSSHGIPQRPSAPVNATLLDPLQLETAEQIAHRDRRLGSVPVHVGARAGGVKPTPSTNIRAAEAWVSFPEWSPQSITIRWARQSAS